MRTKFTYIPIQGHWTFLKIFDDIFSIAKGVQHDGRLPFWKLASVFAHYVRIV